MKTVVCVRQAPDGELNPFDECAYETALRIPENEVILLTMSAPDVKDFMLEKTRLGAKKAILLCDKAFAGADTLATSYTLATAIKKINPDLIICGRQTLNGDTGQVGIGIATELDINLITNVMAVEILKNGIKCKIREGGSITASFPALLTVERINKLRFPGMRSKYGEVEIWDAEKSGVDLNRCGIKGSPTKVVKTFENAEGRRNCKFITADKFNEAVTSGLEKKNTKINIKPSEIKLKKVYTVGEKPLCMAQTVSDDITVIPLSANPDGICDIIKKEKPNAVLWASDMLSKWLASVVAVKLKVGLCADCTLLETDGNELYMYRPAFSGNIIAEIVSTSLPKMATVRTLEDMGKRMAFCIGMGAKGYINEINALALKYNADVVATRDIVDAGKMPYETQVGLTGKSINPDVYVTFGVSGAVHHIAGCKQSGTIISVNTDKNAPMFNYSDYGILADVGEFLKFI